MRSWLVGGAVIEGPDGVLLVQNRRRDGRVDWTPPGGVIDEGEELLAGLTREVSEETGLAVIRWSGPIYEIEVEAPGLGWNLRVEVHRAEVVDGDLLVDDPDGIVVGAEYVPVDVCHGHLVDSHQWVRDPLRAWLAERWDGSRSFRYLLDGSDPRTCTVTVRS
jgi:8-oxo-dGTP diphosphatase